MQAQKAPSSEPYAQLAFPPEGASEDVPPPSSPGAPPPSRPWAPPLHDPPSGAPEKGSNRSDPESFAHERNANAPATRDALRRRTRIALPFSARAALHDEVTGRVGEQARARGVRASKSDR